LPLLPKLPLRLRWPGLLAWKPAWYEGPEDEALWTREEDVAAASCCDDDEADDAGCLEEDF